MKSWKLCYIVYLLDCDLPFLQELKAVLKQFLLHSPDNTGRQSTAKRKWLAVNYPVGLRDQSKSAGHSWMVACLGSHLRVTLHLIYLI